MSVHFIYNKVDKIFPPIFLPNTHPGYVSLALGDIFIVGIKQKLFMNNVYFRLLFPTILKVLCKDRRNTEREQARE